MRVRVELTRRVHLGDPRPLAQLLDWLFRRNKRFQTLRTYLCPVNYAIFIHDG